MIFFIALIYNKSRNVKVLIVNKFFTPGFCLLICLTGCKESEKKSLKDQIYLTNQKEDISEKDTVKNRFKFLIQIKKIEG